MAKSRVLDLGRAVTVASIELEAIAAVVNTLDRDNNCKRNVLAAARELCWECESRSLIDCLCCGGRANGPLVGGGLAPRLTNLTRRV